MESRISTPRFGAEYDDDPTDLLPKQDHHSINPLNYSPVISIAKEDLDTDQEVILSVNADWNTWYSYIYLKAKAEDLWKYIDPDGDQTLEPVGEPPDLPAIPDETLEGDAFEKAYDTFMKKKDIYTFLCNHWMDKHADFVEKNTKLVAINDLIYKTAFRHRSLFNETGEEEREEARPTVAVDGQVLVPPPAVGSARARLIALRQRLKPSSWETRARARALYFQSLS